VKSPGCLPRFVDKSPDHDHATDLSISEMAASIFARLLQTRSEIRGDALSSMPVLQTVLIEPQSAPSSGS